MEKTIKRRKNRYQLRDYIFVYSMLIIPLLQFLFLFVFVKVDSIFLAFQKYDTGKYIFSGFDNFIQIFKDYFSGEENLMFTITKNSFLIFLAGTAWIPVPLYVSYIIWKKVPLSGLYKVILFLPNILPSMVTTLAFRYLVGLGFPEIFGNANLANLIGNDDTMNSTLYWYTRWIGIGGSLVLYLGAMSAVDQSLVEYGRLDGLTFMGEFWHIVLPKIYPTLSALIVTSFGGMLTSDLGLYSFFREKKFGSLKSTLGYQITVMTLRGQMNYPYLSALGLLISIITIPTIFAVKGLMEKYGPSED